MTTDTMLAIERVNGLARAVDAIEARLDRLEAGMKQLHSLVSEILERDQIVIEVTDDAKRKADTQQINDILNGKF